MLTFRDLSGSLQRLDVPRTAPVIVHASLSSFGEEIRGGAETLLGALLACTAGLMIPAFTYKTMIIPEAGPPNNGIAYGSGRDLNRQAVFFTPGMPADRLMGRLSEAVLLHPSARRSEHPILSFAGIHVEQALLFQSIAHPLAPIEALAEMDGWVILAGVDHTVNTSLHLAELRAGRKQFLRWALTSTGVVECPGFPGCSDGFERASPSLAEITRTVTIGGAVVRALPLQPMISMITDWIRSDPLALLCRRSECERCDAVRKAVILSQPPAGGTR